MENDIVVVAALGEGKKIGAGLVGSKSVPCCKRTKDCRFEEAGWSLRTLGAWLL